MKAQTYEMMHEVVAHEVKMLEVLYEIMDAAEYEKAIEILKNSTLTVTSACGSSGFAAKKFAHSLCCVERPAKFVPPSEAIHGGMGALKPGNAIIIISRGGKSEELMPLISIAKTKGAKLIAVTANPESELGRAADAVLLIPDFPESDKYGVMATASFTANCAIFDALMIGLMEEDDYRLEQFAVIHPGGAVGKRIN